MFSTRTAEGPKFVLCEDFFSGVCHLDGTGGNVTLNFSQDYVDRWENVVWGRIVPGIGWSLMFGNLWYAWMAYRLAAHEGRTDVTALPYGINTPLAFTMSYDILYGKAFDGCGCRVIL